MSRLAPWVLLALPGLADVAIAGPIRFEEIGEKAGARVHHHTHKFSGKHADVLGMFTARGGFRQRR
jgi:hypothetical protein